MTCVCDQPSSTSSAFYHVWLTAPPPSPPPLSFTLFPPPPAPAGVMCTTSTISRARTRWSSTGACAALLCARARTAPPHACARNASVLPRADLVSLPRLRAHPLAALNRTSVPRSLRMTPRGSRSSAGGSCRNRSGSSEAAVPAAK